MKSPVDRAARLARLHTLFNEQPDGWQPRDLADALDVDVRTIQRDLWVLRKQLPLVRQGWIWRLAWGDETPLPPLALTRAEARLLLARLPKRAPLAGRLRALLGD
jgi:predicted DNA-binding transcriptional regulator YafY